MDDAALLEIAVGLAREAAAAILRVRAAGFSVTHKMDASPVTEADRAAEAIIAGGLRAAAPGIAVVAEEEVAAGIAEEAGESFWLVDPLDGTREFAAGGPDYTVNIGLVRAGAPVLGVVALPGYGEVFSGLVGQGAWKDDAAGTRRIAARRVPAEGLTAMASAHYAGKPELQARLAAVRVARVVNVGSGIKFCRLAEGVADYYPRLERMKAWDTAAPQAVLEAAGGRVVTFDGAALRYLAGGDWAVPPFEAFGA